MGEGGGERGGGRKGEVKGREGERGRGPWERWKEGGRRMKISTSHELFSENHNILFHVHSQNPEIAC